MEFFVRGERTFASTGGRAHVPGAPNIVFIHGSGQNRLTWIHQSRKAAYRGYNVLALDLPGHGNSAGECLSSIETQADWIVDAMAAADMDTATIVGHSQGVLNVLEIASRFPALASQIILISAALAIPVNDLLLKWGRDTPTKAFAAMTGWGHGDPGHRYDNTMPGHNHLANGINLMAMNADGTLSTDLNACNKYQNGRRAATTIFTQALVVLSEQDKMTPIKSGRELVDTLPNAKAIELAGTGHFSPVEGPQEINDAIFNFMEN
mgnify:CR=1 FL=1